MKHQIMVETDLEFSFTTLLPYLLAVMCPPIAISLNKNYTLYTRAFLTILDLLLAYFWFPFGLIFSIIILYRNHE